MLFTTDRGLAGPLNTNTSGSPPARSSSTRATSRSITVGRKGRDAMRRAGVPLAAHFDGFGDRPTFADVLPLARLVTDDFLAGTYGRVDLVYSQLRLDARPAARRS